LDVIKTRIQLQTGTSAAGGEAYTGMLDCFQKIVKTEG
jgi:solute carrier family 25 2-oxodicarboxylate transporter 21